MHSNCGSQFNILLLDDVTAEFLKFQHDPDFVGKIHDAYVKSLQQAYEGRQF